MITQTNPINTGQINSFRIEWARSDSERLRLRVNDDIISTDAQFGEREESRHNGLALIDLPEAIRELSAVRLVGELWGGHPLTTRKRFAVNGRRSYDLPDDGVSRGHCAYSFPEVPIDLNDLVQGANAVQFSCERGLGFWGHFIVDNLGIRTTCSEESSTAVNHRRAIEGARIISESRVSNGAQFWEFSLECRSGAAEDVVRVDYLVHHAAYAFEGGFESVRCGTHAVTKDRLVAGHAGGADAAPFVCRWQPEQLLPQACIMMVGALITFRDGSQAQFPAGPIPAAVIRTTVTACGPRQLPIPFWSRDGRAVETVIPIPQELVRSAVSARLVGRFWDGADDDGGPDIQLNGVRFPLLDGSASHDLVNVSHPFDPQLLVGENLLTVRSDTVHHGVEVLLPGLVIMVTTAR